MKTIGLYMVVGFSGIIFVTADGQGDFGCDHRAYVPYLPTYVVVLFEKWNIYLIKRLLCIELDYYYHIGKNHSYFLQFFLSLFIYKSQMLTKGLLVSFFSFFFRFLSSCCSNNIGIIHNNNTINKICSGMYASYIDISCRDKFIQYNAIFYIVFYI